MTVATSYAPASAVGNGTTQTFAAPWSFLAVSHLAVVLFDTVANAQVSPAPQLNGSGIYDFTVAPTLDGRTNEYTSATITLNSAPPSNIIVSIIRVTPERQGTQFSNAGSLPSTSIETGLDAVVLSIQEATQAAARAVQAPAGEGALVPLPQASARAGLYLAFDSTGQPTAVAGSTSVVPVSSVMSPVISASSVLAALALLSGVGTVPNFASLRALSGPAPAVLFLEGYTTAGDGGEGPFWNKTTDTTNIDNGGTVAVDALGRRWHRFMMQGVFNVLHFGATGNGVTNDATAIQNCINAAESLLIPPAIHCPSGRYVVDTPITITQGLHVYGDMVEPQQQQFQAFDIGGRGTWFVLDGTALISPFVIAPQGSPSAYNQAFGVELDHIGIYHTQPASAPGWTPSAYPAAILMAGASDIYLHDIVLVNPTIGIQNTTLGGRIKIKNIKGQPLTSGIVFDDMTDVCTVDGVHWWVFWTEDANILAYQQANAVAFKLGRIDNPDFSNCFSYTYNIGVSVAATANGGVSEADFVNCGFDSCNIPVQVNDSYVSGHTLTFTNCYGQGPTGGGLTGIGVFGSGNNAKITFIGGKLAQWNNSVCEIGSSGVNNQITILGSILTQWAYSGGAAGALGTTANNAILADATCTFYSVNNPTLYGSGAGFTAKMPISVRGALTITAGQTSATVGHTLNLFPNGVIATPNAPITSATSWYATATSTTVTITLMGGTASANIPFTFELLNDGG